jgi:putative hemolysin
VLFLQTVSVKEKKMANLAEKTIDIDKILKEKLGPKAKFVPGFLVSWLKRIVHQDQVNAFLWESREKTGVEWLEECVRYLDMTLEVEGKENLPSPADGRLYTFVSNHPLGGEDGVALGAIIGRHYDGRFRYLVNDLLMNLPGLAPVCIPINKTGKQSRNFPVMVELGFKSDNHMLMFPAGLCSRKKKGVVSDIPWTKTFISKSVEYQRDVVPIRFSGQNSKFFYRLANFSDRFLPFNLAMLFLVDEMYKNVHKTFHVTIGKPIPWQTFDKSRSQKDWAQFVREQVYQL